MRRRWSVGPAATRAPTLVSRAAYALGTFFTVWLAYRLFFGVDAWLSNEMGQTITNLFPVHATAVRQLLAWVPAAGLVAAVAWGTARVKSRLRHIDVSGPVALSTA